jgi:topoisomerase IA-like protein
MGGNKVIVSPEIRRKIEQKAYDFFVERGGQHGYHIEDWLRAERAVLNEIKSMNTNEEVKPIKKTRAKKTTAKKAAAKKVSVKKVSTKKKTAKKSAKTKS